jgi:hypothetical protein
MFEDCPFSGLSGGAAVFAADVHVGDMLLLR